MYKTAVGRDAAEMEEDKEGRRLTFNPDFTLIASGS